MCWWRRRSPVSAGDFTAIAVYSDMERTGFFESSNSLLDKFVENTVWSAKNNHADLPTDCPTRERARLDRRRTDLLRYGKLSL